MNNNSENKNILSHQLSEKEEMEKEKEIDKELKNIYKQGGKIPDLAKLEHKNRNGFWGLIIVFTGLLLILTVAVLGFFIFQPKPKYTGDKINLEIKAPFNASSGERISYEIKLTNGEEISLTKVQLSVYLPQGFIFENAGLMSKIKAPSTENPNPTIRVWLLEDLFSGQSQSITITGKLIGQTNTKQPISATLSYYPANFNSEFQKNISFNTEIVDTLANFELEYPTQAANLDEITFNLKVKNKSEDTEISNVQIELNLPEDFTLKEKLDLQANQKIWEIAKLMPGEEVIIKFIGKFEVDESKNEEFILKLKAKGLTEEYIDQVEKKYILDIIKGDLLTNLIINGSSQNKALNFSETLNCLLVIENKSKKILGDLKARLILDSALLDWSTLVDSNNGMVHDNQILWTKEQVSQLDFIIPEGEIEIPFQIKLKEFDASKKYKDDDLSVRSFFETQINKINDKDTQVVVQSNTLINEINTNFDFSAQIRYFADNHETIGSGPLPPIVGQTTSYKVLLSITNSLHEINNIKVQIKLPSYVNYLGHENVSAGNIALAEQNQVLWQVSRIPNSVNQTTAEFEISINPLLSDANKILSLISEISASATDAQTQSTITKTISGLTTNLEDDNLGKNKGVVQEQ